MEADFTRWLHLLAFATYTGATLALVAMCLPVIRREADPRRRLQLAAFLMRVYDPLSIGALGVLIMTGAFSLTGYKATLRATFFEHVGVPLAWKLLFTFVLVNLAAYVAFGLGHRLVRTVDLGDEIDVGRLDAMLRRLQLALFLALVLAALILWIAVRLATGLPPPAAV